MRAVGGLQDLLALVDLCKCYVKMSDKGFLICSSKDILQHFFYEEVLKILNLEWE